MKVFIQNLRLNLSLAVVLAVAFRTLDGEGVEREVGALLDGAPYVLVKFADEEITVPVNPSKFRRDVSIPCFYSFFYVHDVGLSAMPSLKKYTIRDNLKGIIQTYPVSTAPGLK